MAEISGITANGKLVPERQWLRHVARLKSSLGSAIKNKPAAKKLIREKILAAVEKRSGRKFGILFSGGVDSAVIALICKMLGRKFSCYTVGLKGSKDMAAAEAAAKKLKLKLIKKELSMAEVEFLLKKAAKAVPLKDVVNVEVAAVELAAIKLAKRHGDRVLFTGLGAEEIFAGYKRHILAKNANKECWQGLRMVWKRDFLRDCAIVASQKVTFLTPFLDTSLIIAAMRIPAKWKISTEDRKIILREVAADLGLPEQFAFRRKHAAQYGSSVDKAVEKLARSHGFRRKWEYIASISK
ncbi:MAG: asparagine synthase-related protein [Candidatus Woesearchaeota archaeon]